jgi:hypothetical protein
VTGSPPNLVVLSNLNKQFGDNSAPSAVPPNQPSYLRMQVGLGS